MADRPKISLTTAIKAHAERKSIAAQDLASRLEAKNILDPEDVAGGYDAKRVLMTTMGGTVRPITKSDLDKFRTLSRQLGKKFKGGITAKQIIDLSMADRRKRAHDEIRTAAPIANAGGMVKFQTSSGPNSKVSRHYVAVEFMAYDAAVASPLAHERAAREMMAGKIRVDCDCEDHRYMFRYIQTLAKCNAGRPETGFPKLKNSTLKGIACKHTLRVMTMVTQSPTFRSWAAKMIERGREALSGKQKNAKVADMKKFVEEAAKESWRQRAVRTTSEKRAANPQKLAIKLTKAGLTTKKPEAQRKAEARTNAAESAKLAMAQQIAKLKTAGLSEKDIKEIFQAMAKTVN
jgi:hypothetical protein